MRYLLYIALILINISDGFTQPRLVLNNDVYFKLSNNTFIVVSNSAANAITTVGSGGNIVAEYETCGIKWNIGTTTGTYTIPFSKSGSSDKIPLTLTISGNASGSGSIKFSTYGDASWDNSAYMPSGVTHMGNSSKSNNSASVIDRFWIVDATGYTTKPSANLSFTYLSSEAGGSNTITEANLQAQCFNTTTKVWLGPYGTKSSNVISNVSVTDVNFFRAWTLVDNTAPLPIELISFNANCKETQTKINWTTASETNNDYFTVQRSADGINFQDLIKVRGAGNSTKPIYYDTTDNESLNGRVYYRLRQTDYNGKYTDSKIIAVNCEIENIFNVLYSTIDPSRFLSIKMSIKAFSNITVKIYDMQGSLIKTIFNNQYFPPGNYEYMGYLNASGVYVVKALISEKMRVEKIVFK